MTFYKGTKNQLGINRLTDSWNGNHRNQLMFTRNQNQIWVRDIKPNQNQLMFTRNWLLHQILGDRVLNSAKKKTWEHKNKRFQQKKFTAKSPSRKWAAAVRMDTLRLKTTKEHEIGTLKCHQDGFYLNLLFFLRQILLTLSFKNIAGDSFWATLKRTSNQQDQHLSCSPKLLVAGLRA
jgi:hypothetical protein